MSNKYWLERQVKAQEALTTKSIKQTKNQIKKYYERCYKNLLGQYQSTYNEVFLQMKEGKQITPAHLYNLDKYWQLQAQVKSELQKLGSKQLAKMEYEFNKLYTGVYLSIDLPNSDQSWALLDKQAVEQMINQVWCADGKSWSSRVWDNIDKLQQALNDNLINCVVNGSNPSDLKKLLMGEFNCGYYRADMIVRTEMAHIQTMAARDRYLDYGCKEVEFWAEEDEIQCDECRRLHQKRFPIYGVMPVPVHPNCRCCIVPVIETE